MTFITRFAPSPTGQLHLGHAFSALSAQKLAHDHDGLFVLRMEDIDSARCKPEFEAQIYDDLRWLGLSWREPVMRQSERFDAYHTALEQLEALGVTYRCACSRQDIRAALSAPQEGVAMMGPDGPVYPGTCRHLDLPDTAGTAIRLDMARATALTGSVWFEEFGTLCFGTHHYTPEVLTARVGDVVLARRDIGTSYHLSVTVDDAAQKISDVVRGEDLFEATAIHLVLQALLELPTPRYHHHRLVRDDSGKRLAKRDDARALAKYRAEGITASEIRSMVGL